MDVISGEMLYRYIVHRGMSIKMLADAVTARGVKTSKATIGHLVSGHVKRTSDDRARAIAKVLDLPVQVLFSDLSVSIVNRDAPPSRKGVA